MNRFLTYFIGPETVLTAVTVALFWFCGRHNSGEGRDVRLMELILMWLPFALVPLAFATIFVPGAKTWSWLGRTVILTFLAMVICAVRLLEGFGTGAKGQDAGFILVVTFGGFTVAIGSVIAGAMILAAQKPGFATWFREHRIIGSILSVVSVVPLGFVYAFVVTMVVFVGASFVSAFKR